MRLFPLFRAILRDALDADGKKIVNLATPTQDADAANKAYVDSREGGSPEWANIRNKPTSFPPSAHSHESDSWFTAAINAVKSLIPSLPSWLTPSREEPPTQAAVVAKYTKPTGGIPADDLDSSVRVVLRDSIKRIPNDGEIICPGITTGFYINPDGTSPGVIQVGNVLGNEYIEISRNNVIVNSAEGRTIFSRGNLYHEPSPNTGYFYYLPSKEGTLALDEDVQAADAKASSKADRASIAPEYSATSAYSVGQFVYHDGLIYRCTTAIASPGEAWNSAQWSAAQKLDDFFGESNTLLIGTIENHSGGGDITEADLPYDIVSPTAGSETIDDVVYTRYDLQNRAINNIVINTASPAPISLHLPAQLESASKGRDLIVRVKVTDAVTTIPSMQIVAASGETVGFEAENNEWATLKYGVNFYCFTETERSAS